MLEATFIAASPHTLSLRGLLEGLALCRQNLPATSELSAGEVLACILLVTCSVRVLYGVIHICNIRGSILMLCK